VNASRVFLLALMIILSGWSIPAISSDSESGSAPAPSSQLAESGNTQSSSDKRSSSNATGVGDAAKPSGQSVTLYGRIEQLVNRQGASLPRQLQKMTPILDLSPHNLQDDKPFSGKDVKSFPEEWAGIWKGSVTVTRRENMEIAWLVQPAAAYRACQFFKPGSKLTLICRFHREDGQLCLSPPVASGRFKHAEDLVQTVLATSGEGAGSRTNRYSGNRIRLGVSDFGQKTTPIARIETFSFGKRYGPSLGGNFIESDVLSNRLRALTPDTMEQDLVTSGSSHSLYGGPETVSSLGESVVRLTRKEDKLLVELAYVNYQPDGMCVNKCVLEGTLERVGD